MKALPPVSISYLRYLRNKKEHLLSEIHDKFYPEGVKDIRFVILLDIKNISSQLEGLENGSIEFAKIRQHYADEYFTN